MTIHRWATPTKAAVIYVLASIFIGPAIALERLTGNTGVGDWCEGGLALRQSELQQLQHFVWFAATPMMLVGVGIVAWLVARNGQINRVRMIICVVLVVMMIGGYGFVLFLSEADQLPSC